MAKTRTHGSVGSSCVYISYFLFQNWVEAGPLVGTFWPQDSLVNGRTCLVGSHLDIPGAKRKRKVKRNSVGEKENDR